MLADDLTFKKDAIECAQVAESNVGPTNGVINGPALIPCVSVIRLENNYKKELL